MEQELIYLTEEELNELLNNNKISLVEWVEAQPDKYDGFEEWRKRHGLKRDDVSAQIYINEMDEEFMDEEKPFELSRQINDR